MQIGFAARFDTTSAEVVSERFFVDGDADPFLDSVRPVRADHLHEVGFFLLPSQRTWDRVLSFSSELFKRTLKADDAKPSAALLDLRDYLRAPGAHLERAEGFRDVVERVEQELAAYVGRAEAKLAFLPTTGDTEGVLRALTPHLVGKAGPDAPEVPMGRQGSGVISLQTILLLLEVGRRRREQNKSFILAAEEPELHLHPGYHRRLVARLRGVSDQTVVTTHSPEVAAYYAPKEIILLRNDGGALHTMPLLRAPTVPEQNALLRLYTVFRPEVCEALMHSTVVVPEGETEFRWFRGLIRCCATAEGWGTMQPETLNASNLGVLPTQSSHVVATFEQFKEVIDALIPLCDGDESGKAYVKALAKLKVPPKWVARLGDDLALEGVLAWVLEPVLGNEGAWSSLSEVLHPPARTMDALKAALTAAKTRWDYHDAILASIAAVTGSADRVRRFLGGLAGIPSGEAGPGSGWTKSVETTAPEIWIWNIPPKFPDA
jgi:hypothetical protein